VLYYTTACQVYKIAVGIMYNNPIPIVNNALKENIGVPSSILV